MRFLPEGHLLSLPEHQAACASPAALRRAMQEETILEGMVRLCDAEHNLLVTVGPYQGRIPRAEAALGITDGTTREIAILSRVGKPVCFVVTAVEETGGTVRLTLSRRLAQQKALDAMLAQLSPGQVIPA